MSKIESSNTEETNMVENQNSDSSDDEYSKLNVIQTDSQKSGSDSGSDSDSDSDFEKNEDFNNYLSQLSFKDNSELFVVNIAGMPHFYTNEIEKAREYMWDMARACKAKEYDYNCYIRENPNQNYIQVVGYNKFYLLSYERLICDMNVSRVQEIEDKVNLKVNEDMVNDTNYFFTIFK